MPSPSQPIVDPNAKPEPMRLVGIFRPVVVKDVFWQYLPVYDAISNFHGGFIINPHDAANQGIRRTEPLFVSITGPADLEDNDTTTKILPGGVFNVPPGVSVWVNSETDLHAFTAVFGQFAPQPVPTPVPPGTAGWPPVKDFGDGRGPVPWPSGLTDVMYAYLYQEYSDDDDLQEFVKKLNAMQQQYVDTFNWLRLPIYPNENIKGALADWAMEGIYGWPRPAFYSSKARLYGPLNTYWPNFALPLNMIKLLEPKGILIADDDLYKRTLTWHFQKGDGKYFNIRWLKRRVMRFLIGVNGWPVHIDNTDRISVTFGPNYEVTIRVINHVRRVTGGAICNMFGPNGLIPGAKSETPGLPSDPVTIVGPVPPNTIFSTYTEFQFLPYENELKEAIDAGVLELPFQFRWRIKVG